MPNVIITTKHLSTLDWLRAEYPELVDGAVVNSHVSRYQLGAEDTVIGTIPIYVMAKPAEYWSVEFRHRPSPDLQTVDAMRDSGAHLRRFALMDDDHLARFAGAIIGDLIDGVQPPHPSKLVEYARDLYARSKL